MLVHRRSPPHNLLGCMQSPQFVTHLYSWVERGTVRAECLAQEHNTMSPARARTRAARSGDERTDHEATGPLTDLSLRSKHSTIIGSISQTGKAVIQQGQYCEWPDKRIPCSARSSSFHLFPGHCELNLANELNVL